MATIIDGKAVAKEVQNQIKQEVDGLERRWGLAPGLAVVLVGDDPASHIYVRNKEKACKEVGIKSFEHLLAATISEKELLALVNQLNKDKNIHGILVQLPLPSHIDCDLIIESINPDKDVDGFHPYNLGRLAQRRPLLRPCTAYGIMRLLEYYNIDVKGMNCTIVGASNNVGRPMTLELLHAGATITTCHKFTKDLAPHIRDAEIVIVATGVMDIVNPEWFNSKTIAIDVGIHRLDDGSVRGDLNFAAVASRVAMITPVPFGVGPMTIATLLDNTYFAAERLHGR